MWWQVLPPLGIIGALVAVQFAGMGIAHLVAEGKPSYRALTESTYHGNFQHVAYRRDTFMMGNNYENRGLDYITDE